MLYVLVLQPDGNLCLPPTMVFIPQHWISELPLLSPFVDLHHAIGCAGKGMEGTKAYSHLFGLIPRLGFFVGNESRIPYDFHEILVSIVPRPLLVIAPIMDKDATLKDVQDCLEQSRKIYQFYGKPGDIQIYSPEDYNRFSVDMQKETSGWIQEKFRASMPSK